MSMHAEQPFAADVLPDSGTQPPQKRSWLPFCLGGCLIIGVVSIVICGGAGWYAARNFKRLVSDAARQAIVSSIEQTELDPTEKQALVVQVDRVIDQYRTGEISLEDLARILDELSKSAVMQGIVIAAVETAYVEPSGLSDEEKQAAHLTLQRVLRGMHDERIKPGDLDTALAYVSNEVEDGQPQLKNRLTDDELRSFLAECRRVADQAEIPAEPFQIKFSDEFRQAVDRALQPPPP
jgi:hypothetical protein